MLSQVLLLIISTLDLCLATRPFYLFGHMANSIDEVDEFIAAGANSIEADLDFDEYGTIKEFHHGKPCDCIELQIPRWLTYIPFMPIISYGMRDCERNTPAETFLSHIRDIGTPGNPKFKDWVVLLYLDLKLGSVKNFEKAGENVATVLSKHFFNTGKTKVKIIVALEKIEQSDFYKSFVPKIRATNPSDFENIGYDIYTRWDNYGDIRKKFEELGITSRTWQSNGYTSCLPFSISNYDEAIKLRDTPNSYVNKFIVWTIDEESSMQEILALGVDGIMTNQVARLWYQIKLFYIVYHFATHNDDPWQKVFDYNLSHFTSEAIKVSITNATLNILNDFLKNQHITH